MTTATASPTIDHSTLAKLVEAGAVRGAQVVAQPQGWALLVRYGQHERPLAAQRSRQVRTWRRLETLVQYLHGVGVTRFEVDASAFDPASPPATPRPDRAAALKAAHEAAAYDQWFRGQVQAAIDDPAPSIEDAQVRDYFAAKRAELRKRMQ